MGTAPTAWIPSTTKITPRFRQSDADRLKVCPVSREKLNRTQCEHARGRGDRPLDHIRSHDPVLGGKHIHVHTTPAQMQEGVQVRREFGVVHDDMVIILPGDTGRNDVQRLRCVHRERDPLRTLGIDEGLDVLPP